MIDSKHADTSLQYYDHVWNLFQGDGAQYMSLTVAHINGKGQIGTTCVCMSAFKSAAFIKDQVVSNG